MNEYNRLNFSLMKSLFVPIALLALSATVFLFSCARSGRTTEERAPRIVNLINFVRNTEPRPVNISDEELYRTTLAQTELLRRHGLKGTFLLQYDALINPKYQALMKQALAEGSEVGGWWEITQPHVEAAGMEWRGAYPWDWHANVGFSSGYEPQEREKLVDTYMAKFKEVFGRYPASVGSWFIDARTLQYMADRYGIVASCNCRDQVGTDGYTLWGGYWNQGYYPSKLNAYMPAQTRDGQIGVPVFRMLGSDPINQYDSGIGEPAQGVETLEPVYESGGGNPRWIDWFFGMMTEGECLAYQYVQAGQENSFTWPRMQRGLEYQVRVIDSLSRAGKLTVQTLAETGRWFRERFETTPPTSVVALSDCKEAGRGSQSGMGKRHLPFPRHTPVRPAAGIGLPERGQSVDPMLLYHPARRRRTELEQRAGYGRPAADVRQSVGESSTGPGGRARGGAVGRRRAADRDAARRRRPMRHSAERALDSDRTAPERSLPADADDRSRQAAAVH